MNLNLILPTVQCRFRTLFTPLCTPAMKISSDEDEGNEPHRSQHSADDLDTGVRDVQFGDANHARLSGSGCDYHFGPG
jgi:hypothetical protein